MKTVATNPSVPGFEGKEYGYNTLGFYGVISGEDLIPYPELIELVGLEDGVPHNEDQGWLVFEDNGRPLYISARTLVHSVSYDALESGGVVDGTRVIFIGNHRYKIRILTSDGWNRFMYPIHVDDPFNWGWGINYTDVDLGIGSGNGRASWTLDEDPDHLPHRYREGRGSSSVSDVDSVPASLSDSSLGWRVVLEAVTDEELEEHLSQPMEEEGDCW